jgi:hypothetical protein
MTGSSLQTAVNIAYKLYIRREGLWVKSLLSFRISGTVVDEKYGTDVYCC